MVSLIGKNKKMELSQRISWTGPSTRLHAARHFACQMNEDKTNSHSQSLSVFLWGKVVSQMCKMCYFAGSWPLDFPSSRFFSEFQIHWIEVHYKLEDPCHAQTCHIINTIQHMNQTRSLRNSMKIMHCLSKNHDVMALASMQLWKSWNPRLFWKTKTDYIYI